MPQRLLKRLVPALEKRVQRYHKDFDTPLIAELWEEVLSKSFNDVGVATNWTNNRQRGIATDMETKPFGRISCKSGSIEYRAKLQDYIVEINGSRTSSIATLDDKIRFLSKKHADYYFLLSKKRQDILAKKFTYQFYVFPYNLISPKKLTWDIKTNPKVWKGKNTRFTAKIHPLAGHYWTQLPVKYIPFQYTINDSKSSK